MRHICAVTVGRSDFGYLLPVLREIEEASNLRLSLVVTGMHLAPHFGFTVRDVARSGLPIAERVDMLVAGDSPAAIAKSMALGVAGLAQAFDRIQPDVLLLLGDRFETFAAATAMLPFARPIAHIAGGELTEGAVDDAIRHAITKMSHLHFVATDRYRQRVIQLGEEPWRVTVTGAPTLDNLRSVSLLSSDELEQAVGMSLDPAPLLITFHPVTLEPGDAKSQIDALLASLNEEGRPVVFTYPSAEANAHLIINAIEDYVALHANARLLISLGTATYFSLMKHAVAMVGNSSSGIIEAASFGLPVVNIGNRQRGRDRGPNVIDAAAHPDAIGRALRDATSQEFRRSIEGMSNPYGDGRSASRIVEKLQSAPLGQELIMKRFFDQAVIPDSAAS